MGDSIVSIGLSGLAAAQAGLVTTGHNIANVNTPGYSRQETLQSTRPALYTGGGYVGQGVDATTTRRIYSSFLAARTVQTQADTSALDTLGTSLDELDNLFGDATTGLEPALDQFFASMNTLAISPSDVAARQSALAGGQALIGRFHQLDDQLTALRTASNDRVQGAVQTINTLAGRLADLNGQIIQASLGESSIPNDLLDQRDALVAQLNEQVGAHAVVQSDGSYNVFLSNGMALVIGLQTNALAAVRDPEDPQNLQIALKTGSGLLNLRSSDFAGGALSGALAFRDEHLTAAQNGLGRIAVVLGTTFNAQHALGQDATGALGGAFFGVPAPTVQPLASNTGTAALTASVVDSSALTASDYRLLYDGTNYRITRVADGVESTFATLPQTIDGVRIALGSGTPSAGDMFFIEPTRAGARDISVVLRDPARLAAAVPVRSAAALANIGTGSITAPSVDAAYLAAPLTSTVTLTYSSATNQLSGFPATLPVTVTAAGVSTTYAAGAAVPYTPDATISFAGITFSIGGTLANGDVFTVGPNTGGVGDGRNALRLTALARQNTIEGSASYGNSYAELVSTIGGTAQQVQVENTTQAKLLEQAKAAQAAVSGVNLDEEAASLQKYQQAYQAAGKVMAIAAALFETILQMGA